MNKLFIKIASVFLNFRFRNVYVQMMDIFDDNGSKIFTKGIVISLKDFINGNYSEEKIFDSDWLDQSYYCNWSYISLPDTKVWNEKSKAKIISIQDSREYIKKYAKYIHKWGRTDEEFILPVVR